MARVKYRIGDEVAHVDNIGFKLRVRLLIHEDKLLRFIKCTWWEGPVLKEANFHSHELLPWGIAKEGQKHVDDYFKSLETEHLFKNIQSQ